MTEAGQLFSINCSPGGVPKLPVAEALVTTYGLFGDSQADARHHGGPCRAVCLFSLERIRALQGEGHPIGTGTTGENFTLSAIDWEIIAPGTRIELGEVQLEVTSFAAPCRTIRDSFTGQKFVRMSQKHHPGWSRVYAKVLREGLVHTGDQVVLTPAGMERKGWLGTMFS